MIGCKEKPEAVATYRPLQKDDSCVAVFPGTNSVYHTVALPTVHKAKDMTFILDMQVVKRVFLGIKAVKN